MGPYHISLSQDTVLQAPRSHPRNKSSRGADTDQYRMEEHDLDRCQHLKVKSTVSPMHSKDSSSLFNWFYCIYTAFIYVFMFKHDYEQGYIIRKKALNLISKAKSKNCTPKYMALRMRHANN